MRKETLKALPSLGLNSEWTDVNRPRGTLVFQEEFREDLRFWVRTDRKTALRVLKLVEAVARDPFQGVGKPERLRNLGGRVWSRRITQEHRLVYLVRGERVDFLQCRYHY